MLHGIGDLKTQCSSSLPILFLFARRFQDILWCKSTYNKVKNTSSNKIYGANILAIRIYLVMWVSIIYNSELPGIQDKTRKQILILLIEDVHHFFRTYFPPIWCSKRFHSRSFLQGTLNNVSGSCLQKWFYSWCRSHLHMTIPCINPQ